MQCNAYQYGDVTIATGSEIRVRFISLAVIVMTIVVMIRFVMHDLRILDGARARAVNGWRILIKHRKSHLC